MLTLAWKILVCEFDLACHRVRGHWGELVALIMPSVVRQLRCARRMHSLADKLATMRRKIVAFEASIADGAFKEAVDADASIREMLKGLKGDIGEIRCEMAAVPRIMCTGLAGARLGAAVLHLQTVAQETYVAADRLLWQIVEHDRKYGA